MAWGIPPLILFCLFLNPPCKILNPRTTPKGRKVCVVGGGGGGWLLGVEGNLVLHFGPNL